MIVLHRITDPESQAYRFMEGLLSAAFPPEEYRASAQLRDLTARKEIFHNNLICDDDVPVGILSYWDFDRFRYVEHFATLPRLRNRGYGGRVMELLLDGWQRPVVLEVEAPADGLTLRRIGFYRRQGFVLWEREYLQPPYRPAGAWLPMRLMVHGGLRETEFDAVRETIYREVYGR